MRPVGLALSTVTFVEVVRSEEFGDGFETFENADSREIKLEANEGPIIKKQSVDIYPETKAETIKNQNLCPQGLSTSTRLLTVCT